MSQIVASPEISNTATKLFKLCRSGKSGFKKDGTGENGIPPEYLSSGKTLFIEPISKLFLGKGKGYRQTQYVVGASTHYIEDFYEDKDGNLVLDPMTAEQAKKAGHTFRPGLKTQGYNLREEYARAMDLGICFDSGILNLSKYTDDPVLLRFIQEHDQNVDAPRSKENTDRQRTKMFQFAPMVKELDASKSKPVENFDADVAAMLMVQKIRTQESSGNFTYNENKLNMFLAILDEGVGLSAGEVIQKFKIVSQLARKDGATFLAIVNEVVNGCKLAIAVAEETAVLKFTATGVSMLNDTKYESIFTFRDATSKDGCIEELVEYFIGNPAGQHAYDETIRLSDAAKIKLLGKA